MRKLLLVLLASFMITLPNIGMAQSSGSSSSGSSSSSSSSSSSDSESEGESANATGGTPTAAPEAVVAPCADTGCGGGDGADKSDNASNGVGSTLGDAQAGNANFTGYNNTPTYDYDVSYGTVTGSYTVNPSFSNDETQSGNINNSFNQNITPSDSSSMFGFDGPPDGLGSNQPDRYANDYEPKPPNADFTGGADPLTPLNIQITDANKNDFFAGAIFEADAQGGALSTRINGRTYYANPAKNGTGYDISEFNLTADAQGATLSERGYLTDGSESTGGVKKVAENASILTREGLNIKGNEDNNGGALNPAVYGLAHKLQESVDGYERMTGGNDYFHQNKITYHSAHQDALAMDFTVAGGKAASETAAQQTRDILNENGINGRVINEYAKPTGAATGGHIHVEFKSSADAKKFADSLK